MRKVTVVKYESSIKGVRFSDVIGVYSSMKKAMSAITKLMLHVEEDLNDEYIPYTAWYEVDKGRAGIKMEGDSEYLYYCVEYPFDALQTADCIEAIE